MKKFYITSALIIGIVVVVNLLSSEFHFRVDLTEDRQYTLSDATEDILENLEEPVTIKAYFSQNLPGAYAKARRDFQELVIEYAAKSNGMLQFEFIDPAVSDEKKNEAMQNGIQPLQINVRQKDQMKLQEAFMGASISIGDKQDVLSYIPPGYPIEYGLSSAIKKLSVSNKPPVGFLQGHGEPSLEEMQQLYSQLSVLYTPTPVSFSDSASFPPGMKTLVVVRPLDSLSGEHIARFDQFLASGGRIAFALNAVNGNLQNQQGTRSSTGIESWLGTKGLLIQPEFVVDAKCASVTMEQQTPFGMMRSQLPFPYLPLAGNFADHPVAKGLEAIVFQFASRVQYVGDTSLRYTPLVFTSERANVLPAPLFMDVQKQWTEADLPLSNLPLAAALEGRLAGNAASKIVVIGDGDFPINGSGQQAQRVSPDNVNILSNAIDWLTDDTGLIELRTKGVTARPIDEMEESTRTVIKYTNFLVPIVLVVVYGLIRFQRNRIRRLKRMAENYEED